MQIFPPKHRLRRFLFAAAVLLLPVLFVWLSTQIHAGTLVQSRAALEDQLRRAAVHCYAVEGRYPPDLDYLCQNYGVHLSDDQYFVFYEPIASNLMPDITVVDRAKEAFA